MLRYQRRRCDGNNPLPAEWSDEYPVSSGGYNIDSKLRPRNTTNGYLGSDTSLPPGNLHIGTVGNGGDINGLEITGLANDTGTNPPTPCRTFMEVHCRHRPAGSSGCIAFPDGSEDPTEDADSNWRRFYDLICDGNIAGCTHNPPRPIPLTVRYDPVAIPTYNWNPGVVVVVPTNPAPPAGVPAPGVPGTVRL